MRGLFVGALLVLVALLGVAGAVQPVEADAASVVELRPRNGSQCPPYDLTGRELVSVTIISVAEVICNYTRGEHSEECPLNAPTGWTVVGKIDAPRNKDKVSCVYQPILAVE
jgi:hypothetical protein